MLMDVHFNAYKAKYEIMDNQCRAIERAQYIKSIDIFINLDDIIHNLHRPLVNSEFQVCGLNAPTQFAANIINVIAHYKRWAAKKQIPAKVYAYYTSSRMGGFKNNIYNEEYRKYFSTISDKDKQEFFFINGAVNRAIGFVQNICDYVEDVYVLDSRYVEPSVIPLFLKEAGIAKNDWGMVVSRDMYDLQYAYRDKWIHVAPKGDDTTIIDRGHLWKYIEHREKIPEDKVRNSAYFHHDLYPLALAVVGNKFRSIPRLKRIGWRTVFKYLDTIVEQDTVSMHVLGSRFYEMLIELKVDPKAIEANLSCVNITQQVKSLNSIDIAMITDQLKMVSDHNALNALNDIYFSKFPINVQFLTASYRPNGIFSY